MAAEPFYLDFYAGALGPTIRIGLNSPEALAAFRHILQDFISGSADTLDLHARPEICLLTPLRITLEKTESTAVRKSLTREHARDGAASFRWRKDQEGWDNLLALFAGLGGGPGHHYGHGVDDATVEVCYLEG